jgi:membrane protein implicated in regulation of membrane protease activity
MGIRIPNLAVLLVALLVGALAVYRGNMVIAALCFSVAVAYGIVILWQWRNRRKKK